MTRTAKESAEKFMSVYVSEFFRTKGPVSGNASQDHLPDFLVLADIPSLFEETSSVVMPSMRSVEASF
jgi:hypothetical protein